MSEGSTLRSSTKDDSGVVVVLVRMASNVYATYWRSSGCLCESGILAGIVFPGW